MEPILPVSPEKTVAAPLVYIETAASGHEHVEPLFSRVPQPFEVCFPTWKLVDLVEDEERFSGRDDGHERVREAVGIPAHGASEAEIIPIEIELRRPADFQETPGEGRFSDLSRAHDKGHSFLREVMVENQPFERPFHTTIFHYSGKKSRLFIGRAAFGRRVLARQGPLTVAINRTGGTLLFIFIFPLINNLPYFFGIAEPFPFAPTAYEIKYTFWLLVGFVFCLRQPEKGDEKPRWFKKKEIVAGLILIIAFSAIPLWNSTHSLSLESRTAKYGFNREFGLDKLEKTSDGRKFRWTREYGGIPVKIEKSALSIPLHASHPDIRKKPVKVRIYLVKDFFKHKTFLKEITLSRNEWQDIALTVPPEDVGQEAILLLKISRTWNPLKTKGVPDPRNRGVAVGKITFRDK